MKYLPNGGLEYSVTWPINGAGSTNLSINSHANLLTRANHGIFFCGLFLIYVEWIINKYDKEIPSVVNLKANIINKFIEQTNQCAILHNIRLNVFHSSQIGSRFCKDRAAHSQLDIEWKSGHVLAFCWLYNSCTSRSVTHGIGHFSRSRYISACNGNQCQSDRQSAKRRTQLIASESGLNLKRMPINNSCLGGMP